MDLSPPPETVGYARFAKRDLDKMSWLAPLVNNRAGDLLNVELRHEQLFFIQNDQVVENIGYSEKGKRFSEADYGKVIRNFDDLKKCGYWFVGRTYDPEVMRRVLERADSEPRVLPTEPASIRMGFVAVALGVGGFIAPVIAGGAFTVFLGALLLAAGLSNIVYALHARDWRNLPPELLTGAINVATGVLMLSNREFARMAGSGVLAVALAIHGAINVFLGAFSKPRSHWIGKLVAGLVMLVCAALIVARWPLSGERLLGATVGLSLFAGGIGTIWLNWKSRASEGA